jgi:hypothetical protein
MADTIFVKTHPNEGERVGLAEKHPDHPKTDAFPQGGEIYVAGQDQEPQEVARTASVLEALAAKRLIEVTSRGRAVEPEEPAAATPPTPPTPPSTPARGGGR